jgi:hypothetical protein
MQEQSIITDREIQAQALVETICLDDTKIAQALFTLLSFALRACSKIGKPEDSKHAYEVINAAHQHSYIFTQDCQRVLFNSVFGEGAYMSEGKTEDDEGGVN